MMYLQGVVILKRSKLSLHSFADSTWKLGFGNVAGGMGTSRSITTTRHNLLGSGVQSGIKSIQQQIINAVRLGERGKASNMLLGLGHQSCSITSDDFMEILKYCASLPDPLFAIDTWNAMVEKKTDLNERCFLLVMRALCNGGYLEEATNMINLSKEGFGLHDSLSMYNSLLRACLKVQSTDLVNQCLDLMERRMIGKNEVTYLELLKFAVQQQNLPAVNEIWKDYRKLYSPSMISLQSLIWSFARLGDLGSAYEKLQYMVALGIQGDVCIFRTVKVGLHSSRLDIPIPANGGLGLQKMDLEKYFSIPFEQLTCLYDRKEMTNFDLENRESVESIGLTKHLSKPAMRVLSLSFNILIHACGRVQNCELAEKLMMQVQKLGLEPSSHAYDGLIRAVAAKRGHREGMKVLRIMQQHNLKPLDSTLAALAVGCCKATELDLAEALLDHISNCPFAYPYNAFLDACEKMDQRERAVRMLAKMKQLKVRPDIRTYELMFLLFGAFDSPYQKADLLTHEDIAKRIKAIEMDMASNGIQHSHCSMKYLMKALGAAGMIKELLQYLGKAEDLFCRSKLYLLHKDAFLGTPIYNKVLHSLVEAKENHLAFETFKSMKSKDFCPDGNTYNIMIQCCVDLQHKFAFSLLSQMLRDGFFPTNVTYASLVKVDFLSDSFKRWKL
ncbi:hypothetical protein K2173_018952 [Erythroxylum novogranatense]|uniref:Pentatricopeptide repeat-containing protein n=1 Tax=Erythroxylum novogranatense TaxID=1862640 RepID=A0AAV8ST65_9ROSI|nr:hypothetical protein K2173_018952 [Erythroxylum novogranatense]